MSVSTAPPETTLITGEELLEMGDVGPAELVDGRIVPMSPTGGKHALIGAELARQLANFVKPQNLGWILVGEAGIYTRRNPDSVREADLAFISRKRLPKGLPKGFLEVAPDLVVEIMSPSDRWQDVRQKLEEYFAIGVGRVWIVEPENRTVLVYRSDTEMQKLGESGVLAGEGPLEGFTLPVAELFAE